MTSSKKSYLLPGFYIATNESMVISTILGSCVAVALYDPNKKIAGLCHYLLSRIADIDGGPIARYGDQAIPMLIDEMVQLGANPRSLIAKVYGGGNVLGNVTVGISVGIKNISIAHEILKSMNIRIVHEDTGGTRGRKLLLSSDTFEVRQTFMEESRTSSAPAPQARSMSKSLRALIIDPTPRTHGNFDKILAESGLNVIGTVVDTFDAFNAITKERPDILIFGLPVTSKNQLQHIKDLKKMTGSLPPFYIYSVGGTGLQATQALELGARDFVHSDTAFNLEIIKATAALLVEKIRENSSLAA